jgi:hypothetical protein
MATAITRSKSSFELSQTAMKVADEILSLEETQDAITRSMRNYENRPRLNDALRTYSLRSAELNIRRRRVLLESPHRASIKINSRSYLWSF